MSKDVVLMTSHNSLEISIATSLGYRKRENLTEFLTLNAFSLKYSHRDGPKSTGKRRKILEL